MAVLLTTILKITSSFVTSKLISTNKNHTIEGINGSNIVVDKDIIKLNIIDKANIRTFQLKIAKSKEFI